MSRLFHDLFTTNSGSGGGGSSGNAIVADASRRLHFGYIPAPTSSSPSSVGDLVQDIPYVAKPFTLNKQQIESAACSVSRPSAVISARLVQIRNNQPVRTFAVNFAGAGQIQPPNVNAQFIAGNSFQTVAGQGFEFAASYTDSQGNSGIGTPQIPTNSGLDISLARVGNIVYLIGNEPGSTTIPSINRRIDLSLLSASNITAAPFRNSDGKEAGNFQIRLGPQQEPNWSTLSMAVGFNQPPTPYDSGNTSATSMEYCWGLMMPGNTMVRLSEILTTNRVQFYGGNGWSESGGSFTNRGRECLIRAGTLGNQFFAVNAIFMWRPVGRSEWCAAVNMTYNNFPIASWTSVSSNLYNNTSQKYTEATVFPSFAWVDQIRVNYSLYSQSLGIVDGTTSNMTFYARNNADQFVIPKLGTYVYQSNIGASEHIYRGLPFNDPKIIAGSGNIQQITIMQLPTNQLMDNSSNRESISSPKGDELYTGLRSYAIQISIPAHANATSAVFYIRPVTRNLDGTLTRGNWSIATGDTPEENSVFTKTIRRQNANSVTPPATNTTNNYSSSYVGKVIWDSGEPIVSFEIGDQFRLQQISHNFAIGGVPGQFNISMEYSLT